MKKYLMLIALLLIAVPAFAATGNVNVKVNGLVCDFCAQSLTKLFEKEPTVNTVKVNLDDGLITLDLKEGQTLADDTIKKLVADSGYTVTGIERAK